MEELYHHGILGQHWGRRNGPPYPLSRAAHNKVVSGRKKTSDLTKSQMREMNVIQGVTGGGAAQEEEEEEWEKKWKEEIKDILEKNPDYEIPDDYREFQAELEEMGIDTNKFTQDQLSKMHDKALADAAVIKLNKQAAKKLESNPRITVENQGAKLEKTKDKKASEPDVKSRINNGLQQLKSNSKITVENMGAKLEKTGEKAKETGRKTVEKLKSNPKITVENEGAEPSKSSDTLSKSRSRIRDAGAQAREQIDLAQYGNGKLSKDQAEKLKRQVVSADNRTWDNNDRVNDQAKAEYKSRNIERVFDVDARKVDEALKTNSPANRKYFEKNRPDLADQLPDKKGGIASTKKTLSDIAKNKSEVRSENAKQAEFNRIAKENRSMLSDLERDLQKSEQNWVRAGNKPKTIKIEDISDFKVSLEEAGIDIDNMSNSRIQDMYKEYKSEHPGRFQHSAVDPHDEFLAHHGILGMKWGVRRYQPYGQGGYTPEGKAKKLGNRKKDILGRQLTEDQIVERGLANEDHYRARSKTASEMTDAELRNAIIRLQNEKRYKELTTPQMKQAEKSIAQQALDSFVKGGAATASLMTAIGQYKRAAETVGLISKKENNKSSDTAKKAETAAKVVSEISNPLRETFEKKVSSGEWEEYDPLTGRRIKHSSNDSFLAHYGVKGMQWGVYTADRVPDGTILRKPKTKVTRKTYKRGGKSFGMSSNRSTRRRLLATKILPGLKESGKTYKKKQVNLLSRKLRKQLGRSTTLDKVWNATESAAVIRENTTRPYGDSVQDVKKKVRKLKGR